MKPTKSILILLSLFLISNCGDGIKDVVVEKYDDGSKKVVERYMSKGLLMGRYLYQSVNYGENGELDGEWISYWEKGEVKNEEGHYKDGKRDGKWVVYDWFDGNGILEEGNYKNGEKEGKWIYYYIVGKVWEEEYYEDGKLEGQYIEYYENGDTLQIGNYKDGEEIGEWIYYIRGKKRIINILYHCDEIVREEDEWLNEYYEEKYEQY